MTPFEQAIRRELTRLGYSVRTVRNGWLVAQNSRLAWTGEKRSDYDRAWQDAAHHAGLGSAVAPL